MVSASTDCIVETKNIVYAVLRSAIDSKFNSINTDGDLLWKDVGKYVWVMRVDEEEDGKYVIKVHEPYEFRVEVYDDGTVILDDGEKKIIDEGCIVLPYKRTPEYRPIHRLSLLNLVKKLNNRKESHE